MARSGIVGQEGEYPAAVNDRQGEGADDGLVAADAGVEDAEQLAGDQDPGAGEEPFGVLQPFLRALGVKSAAAVFDREAEEVVASGADAAVDGAADGDQGAGDGVVGVGCG